MNETELNPTAVINEVPYHAGRKKDVLWYLAQLISTLFHPLFLAVYGFLFVNAMYPFLFAHLSKVEKGMVVIRLVINTIAFPFITIFMMQRLGFAKTIQLHTREERVVPYIAMSLFYFWSYMVIRSMAISQLFSAMMLGAAIAIFIAFFLNNFFKISAHAVGAGSFVAIVLITAMASNYNVMLPLMLVILLAGLVGTARLYLRAHTINQVITGYMVGIMAQLIAMWFALA